MSRPPLETLEGFLERYPMPERLDVGVKPMEWLWEYDISVDPARLWSLMSDTSRLNRALGLARMEFVESDGVLHGSSVNGGRRHEWVEEPWTWVSGQSLCAIRVYSRGYAHSARAVYHFEPSADGNHRLLVYFGWVPRGVVGRLALRVGMPSLEGAYRKVIRKLEADIERAQPVVYSFAPRAELSEPAARRVSELRAQLEARDLDPVAVSKLFDLITTGDDMDVYRIQPRRLAHDWSVDERALLSVCLHATRIGLLDLSWDVICPHCRGVRAETDSLADVAGEGACDVCEVDFSTDIENAVEVTFHVHSSIRTVPKVYYCSAEPATKQHIKLQERIPGGSATDVTLSLAPGRYRMRLLGDRVAGYLTISDGADSADVSWGIGSDVGDLEARSPVTLRCENAGDADELVVVEDVRWTDEALRPSLLFSLQEFRDLFSEEYLGAEVQLSVGEQTLLFTDMIGSTLFYRELGDPAAFIKVKDHFRVVFDIVEQNGGAVVKTIGDAVMAAFSDGRGAVAAAAAMHEAFPALDGQPDAIRLRVSINSGPCIAVNLNTGIDYFGGTVNIAAKLQACCEAGEVALSQRVFEAPGVADSIRARGDEFDARVFEHSALESVPYVFWRVT